MPGPMYASVTNTMPRCLVHSNGGGNENHRIIVHAEVHDGPAPARNRPLHITLNSNEATALVLNLLDNLATISEADLDVLKTHVDLLARRSAK